MKPSLESPPQDVPVEEHGVSLLRPVEEAAALRRRRERPAKIGRYLLILLGGICAGAGAALWATTSVALIGVAMLGFGLLLIALGATLHLVLLRDRYRWPEAAHAWDEGLELLLHDGELRAASWTDPELALDIFVRPQRRTSDEERLLVWRMESGIPPCDLSQDGLDRLLQVVAVHDLRLAEYRRGGAPRAARAYEIRGRTYRPLPGLRAAPPDPSRSTP
jgi:hypothetical protein